jgi:protoheme IX farnesyltransferase
MGAEPSAPTGMNRFQKLTLATAGTTILLFAVGGLVRGTGSGLGCSTWPACEPGQLFPSGTIHSLIEFSHRALVFVVSVLVGWTAIEAFRRYRGSPVLFWPAVAAIPLVLGQAVLGGVVVHTELDPAWVTVHFAVALALVADVTFLAARALLMDRTGGDGLPDRGFARLVWVTSGATAALLLVGTYVRARDAGLAFTDWPLLGGRLVPGLDGYTTPMFLHRLLAALVFLLVLWIVVRARTASVRSPEVVRLSTLLLALFVMQILSGAANVWSRLRPWAVVLHVGLSVLIWATTVALATVTDRLARLAPASAGEPGAASGGSIRERVTAYVRLTKPRIIVLLLITTVPAMILAARGVPSLALILATLVGGAIAAGSANAINMYLDRDIDEVMQRTRQRPLPAHAVTPERALRFGFVLGVVAFYFLAIVVNVLAATLALSAIAFYVFVYTLWLKRSSPQNIVIGGAAGAVPALVGWAAVTGTLALPAWILFAIVFVWTPPHFWALSMRFQGEYAAAGVPMLPVVRGEDETRRQILLYSLVLFAVTLVLVPVGHMGPVYIATAVVLGGSFVYRSLRLWREGGDVLAWKLFQYSIVYLAALFGAVAVDAIVS